MRALRLLAMSTSINLQYVFGRVFGMALAMPTSITLYPCRRQLLFDEGG